MNDYVSPFVVSFTCLIYIVTPKRQYTTRMCLLRNVRDIGRVQINKLCTRIHTPPGGGHIDTHTHSMSSIYINIYGNLYFLPSGTLQGGASKCHLFIEGTSVLTLYDRDMAIFDSKIQ